MLKWIPGIILGVIVLGFIGLIFAISNTGPQTNTVEEQQLSEEELQELVNNMNEQNDNSKSLSKPEMVIDTSKKYQVTLKTTEGDIVIELDTQETPITANNFVYLAENDFYDNTIFHRVIDGFMIQGGDPTGTGTGSPGYRFDDEPITKEYTRGTVAMANSGPDTNGSQFFIMHADYPLPKNYVIFGQVVSGIEVVDKIATAEVKASSGMTGEMSSPVNPVTVEDAVVSVQ